MNQTFNFKRYLLLLKRQWFENAAIYKWGIVLMVASTLLSFWLLSNWKAIENPHLGQIQTFSIVGFSFLIIFASNFFESLRSKHKGMFYFSLPVSPLERVSIVFSSIMVILPLIFLVIFFVSDFLFVQLFNHVHNTSEQMLFVKTSPSEHTMCSFLFVLAWSILSVIPINALGTLVFGKGRMFIMTVITSIILYVFFSLWVIIYYGSISIYQPNLLIDFLNSPIFLMIIPLCWGMMYYCMKRKEV